MNARNSLLYPRERMPGTLVSVPAEIADDIAGNLKTADLHSLTLVSKRAYDMYIGTMYRDMEISFSGSFQSDIALALVETLATTERLVLLIKRLRLNLFLNAKGTTRELLLQISRFFRSVPAGRSKIHTFQFTAWLEDWQETGQMTIIQDLAEVGPTILGSFNDMRLPYLHTLILDGTLPGLSYLFDTRPFLRAHPHLETLDVSSQFLVPDHDTIPNLKNYTGWPLDCINICDGKRPLRCIKLFLPTAGTVLAVDSDGSEESQDMILTSFGETNTLTELALIPTFPENTCFPVKNRGQGCLPPRLLGCVVKACPNLTHLELYIGDTLVSGPELRSHAGQLTIQFIQEDTLVTLHDLDYLQELVLHCQKEMWAPEANEVDDEVDDAASTAGSDFEGLTEDEVFPLDIIEEAFLRLLLPYTPQLRTIWTEFRGWKRYPGEGAEVEDGDEEDEDELADFVQTCTFSVDRTDAGTVRLVRRGTDGP